MDQAAWAATNAATADANAGKINDFWLATFDDPQNADLISVIDRRRGLPVSLGILYIDLAHRLEFKHMGGKI